MPRANRLPPLRKVCYYYRRKCARGRVIVRDREELEIVFAALAVALRSSRARLYAFHIGPRELHLVMRAGDAPLLPALGTFCHEVTRRMNRRRGESGPVFGARARATVLQPGLWLLPVARYVHAARRSCDLAQFCNSDHVYRTRQRKTGLITTAIVRSLRAHNQGASAWAFAYSAYFDAAIPPEEACRIEQGAPEDSRILGDRAFITRVLQTCGTTGYRHTAAHEGPDQLIRQVAEVVIPRFHALCRQYLNEREVRDWIGRTDLEQLRSRSRRMPLPFVRGMIADYAVTRGLARRSDIEKFFGLHPRSLAAGLRRRYRFKILARLCRGSAVAPHALPYIECGM